jgi:hypothetical protein
METTIIGSYRIYRYFTAVVINNRPYTKRELNRENGKPMLSRENKVAVKLLSNLNVLNWTFYGDIPNGDYSRSRVMEKSVSHGVRPLVDKRWYNQVSTGNPY